MTPRPALFLAAFVLPLTFVAPRAEGAWSMYAGNAQHTAPAAVPTQPLQEIHWQMPVDLQPQYSDTELLIHYGSPLVTDGNTVLVPVKVGVADSFRVEARRGSDGQLLWQLDTDYQLPPHNWTPSMGPALAPPGRVYFPGAGGTLQWTDALDANAPHTSTRVAFFGNAAYAGAPAAFNASLRINTPLTSDSKGTVYFGFVALGSNPLGIQSGIAAVDSAGTGRYVSVSAVTAGAALSPGMNCAPALSHDEQTLYVACRSSGSSPAYLLALATSDLSLRQVRLLVDPVSAMPAFVLNDGTASPMVAPDDRVYMGVLENPIGENADRGWLLPFDAALNPSGAPGAFGWDDTPSIVPRSTVPAYAGSSPYLLMSKYNFYAGTGGNGENKIAVLDPGASQVDALTGATVMQEVRTILGATPDSDAIAGYPTAVKEWCINSAVVDSFTHSVVAGSEDGKLYRWDPGTNTFREQIVLTPGLGEAYTPTLSGPDGQVYAINNATLFAVGASRVGVPAGASVEAGLRLSPARPNPFAGSTTLLVELGSANVVRAEVFDLAGRRVRVLQDGVLPAGVYAISWDGRDGRGLERAAGVYFVRVRDGSDVVTRKVVLTR